MTTRSRIRVAPRAVRFGRAGRGGIAGACLLVALAGCDLNLLEQDAPSRVVADDLTHPSNAALLVRSAISEFECALAQHVIGTGLVAHELRDGSLSEQWWDYDRRTLSPARAQYALNGCGSVVPGNYMALSAARFQADHALSLLEGWTDAEVPQRADLIAQSAAFAGYSLVLLGESMCSAAIDVGPELSRDELFALAESRFERALEAAAAAGNEEITNLVRVGRARARLNRGDLGDAAADALLVPEGFRVDATYSDVSNRRRNRLYTAMYRTPVVTVDSSYHDLTFGGVPDPRVVVVNAGGSALDSDVPLFQAAKYSDVSSPIRIAGWEEARLILAEARLAAGDVAGAVEIINDLHDRVGLPPYGGGTPDEVMAQIIEERRRELFLEGHRLGDLIRYQLPLTPEPGTPFHRGGTYGSQLCFPLPDVERNNNPNM